jgi:hypothetical protein
MTSFQKISAWAKALKLDVFALWFALKHPSVHGVWECPFKGHSKHGIASIV